jgi:hypothetical protein
MQVVHLSQEATLGQLVTDPRIDFVAFTGSVAGGRAVQEAAAKGKGFKGVGLELGGKDPAYVREDADVGFAAENLVDGGSTKLTDGIRTDPCQAQCSTLDNHVRLIAQRRNFTETIWYRLLS